MTLPCVLHQASTEAGTQVQGGARALNWHTVLGPRRTGAVHQLYTVSGLLTDPSPLIQPTAQKGWALLV